MRVIDHRQFQKRSRAVWSWRRWAIIAGITLAGLFVLGNAAMWVAYRDRVLPNVSLGAEPVGNIAYNQVDQEVAVDKLLPDMATFTKDNQTQTVDTAQLGISVDWQGTKENLKRQRTWFPILSIFMHRTVPVVISVKDEQFTLTQSQLSAQFTKQALPERITFNGSDFVVTGAEEGYQLDTDAFKAQLIATLGSGKDTLQVPTTAIAASAETGGLDDSLQTLRKQLAVKLVFKLHGQSIQPTAADIGKWFVQDGRTMALSQEKVSAYVSGLDSVYNADNAAAATAYALRTIQDQTFVLSVAPVVTYEYCTNVRGVDNADTTDFIEKIASTLGDPRGWSLDGKIGFKRVDTGCSFTIWLSASSQMTSFGGVCDSYWSCRSGDNVVINFDRWQSATDTWNAAGLGFEDYHVMVINHEVGHRLGFGHLDCPSPGQPSPVMRQESIDLQGCTFNPWPTASELNTLKQNESIATLLYPEKYS